MVLADFSLATECTVPRASPMAILAEPDLRLRTTKRRGEPVNQRAAAPEHLEQGCLGHAQVAARPDARDGQMPILHFLRRTTSNRCFLGDAGAHCPRGTKAGPSIGRKRRRSVRQPAHAEGP